MGRTRTPAAARKGDNASARARILEAATRLFSDHPFVEISAAEIAKEAGVAHGLMFHYFGTKTKLYEEISRIIATRMEQVHRAALQKGNTEERLRSFLEAHMAEMWRLRKSYVFRSRGGGTKAIQAIWECSRQNAILLILDALGVKKPSNELILMTRAWLGFFDQLVIGWVEGRVKDKNAVVRATLRQLPAALGNACILGAKDVSLLPDEIFDELKTA